jgi:hypothetical protein
MTKSISFWHAITTLVRFDIAAAIALTLALLLWLPWH